MSKPVKVMMHGDATLRLVSHDLKPVQEEKSDRSVYRFKRRRWKWFPMPSSESLTEYRNTVVEEKYAVPRNMLFNPPSALVYPEEHMSLFLDQYNKTLDSAERMRDRRSAVNAFYLTFNTTLVGAVIALLDPLLNDRGVMPILLGFPLLIGIMSCVFWRRSIISYNVHIKVRLSTIINMEECLLAQVHRAESERLNNLKEIGSHPSQSAIETGALWLFFGAYVIALVGLAALSVPAIRELLGMILPAQ